MKPDSVAIVSGGMDSVTLLHYLVKEEKRQPAVLSFNYGQKHNRELICATDNARLLNCEVHEIIDLSPFHGLFTSSALVNQDISIPTIETVQGDPQPLTYVPNRNMVFLSLAAALAESLSVSDVYYGAQRHDMYGYWDTTPTFLEELNAVFALNRKTPIKINAPFVNNSKSDILKIGLRLKLDYNQTWSCYLGADVACGICPTCAERLAAFEELGITDPIPYQAQ